MRFLILLLLLIISISAKESKRSNFTVEEARRHRGTFNLYHTALWWFPGIIFSYVDSNKDGKVTLDEIENLKPIGYLSGFGSDVIKDSLPNFPEKGYLNPDEFYLYARDLFENVMAYFDGFIYDDDEL